MALSPQKFREILFQLLYSHDMSEATAEEMIPLLAEELSVSKIAVRKVHEKLLQLLEKLPEIDEKLSGISSAYSFDRIQTVERNILRLGVFELLFEPQIPAKVALAEAMRLSRKYGSPEAVGFVNAILDAFLKQNL